MISTTILAMTLNELAAGRLELWRWGLILSVVANVVFFVCLLRKTRRLRTQEIQITQLEVQLQSALTDADRLRDILAKMGPLPPPKS